MVAALLEKVQVDERLTVAGSAVLANWQPASSQNISSIVVETFLRGAGLPVD